MSSNPVLREELVTVARQHGFVFAAAELGELDLRDLGTVLDSLEATASPQGVEDDDPSDPGFGIIEVPGWRRALPAWLVDALRPVQRAAGQRRAHA